MGFWAATAKRNPSNMKISHTSLLVKRALCDNLRWTHSFCKMPGKKQSRSLGEYTLVSALMHVGNHRNLWAQLFRHIIFESDCLSLRVSVASVNVSKEEMKSMTGDVWIRGYGWFNVQKKKKKKTGNTGIFVFIFLYELKNKQIGCCFECPRVFSSTDLTLAAPSSLPWCSADGNLGNIPGGGCNKRGMFFQCIGIIRSHVHKQGHVSFDTCNSAASYEVATFLSIFYKFSVNFNIFFSGDLCRLTKIKAAENYCLLLW